MQTVRVITIQTFLCGDNTSFLCGDNTNFMCGDNTHFLYGEATQTFCGVTTQTFYVLTTQTVYVVTTTQTFCEETTKTFCALREFGEARENTRLDHGAEAEGQRLSPGVWWGVRDNTVQVALPRRYTVCRIVGV